MQFRREVPRQPVNWSGKYRFEGDTEGSWRTCRVLDISTAGTGVELFGTTPGEADERRIILSIELVGDVRNTVTTENSLRTGIEFDNVAGEAAAYITSIKNLGTRW